MDKNFFKVLDITLVDGSFFEGEADDTIRKYIINEATVEKYGLTDPVGQPLDASIYEEQAGKIIGVVKNFNFFSLHTRVEPLVFVHWPYRNRYILVEIDPVYTDAAHAHIKQMWKKFNKGHFMHYIYLKDKLNSLYIAELKMLSLFLYFSLFVILISCLGLYGLSSFLIEQRTKEIGIRKILGGSEKRIILLLVKDYLLLVFVAGIIASPMVYYLLNKWLNSFEIHISIHAGYFLFGILIALLFAFLTVLVRSYNVVNRSPSYALKYE